jgi:hypothetical protein
MNTTAIDNQLTTQLALFNGGLNFGNPQGLMEAKLAVGVAIGILSVLAPEDAYMVNAYQRHLMEATTADDLYPLKESVFTSAFAHLNHFNSINN